MIEALIQEVTDNNFGSSCLGKVGMEMIPQFFVGLVAASITPNDRIFW